MSFTKTYFLSPTSDFIHPPPTGPLCLGSIIRSTSAPQHPLNTGSVVAIADPHTFVEPHWKKTISTETGFGFGIYAQFIQLATGGLSLGPEASVKHASTTTSTFAFDKMTTLSFDPTLEYVEEAVKAPAVQAWLRHPRQRLALVNELFIVTGMKIVEGAKIKYTTSDKTNVKSTIGIDVPTIGMSFGPKGHWNVCSADDTESNRESPFVFAFRVARLRFGWRLKLQEHSKGAFMAIGGKGDEDECVMLEDVNGADISTAELVPDVIENGNVYCVPAHSS